MDQRNFVLTLIFCAALIGGPAVPARALGVCEQESGQCNRKIDSSFRQEKLALGNAGARKLQDQRRFECRVALKKCKAVSLRNRDLRASGVIGNSGMLSNPSYAPGR
jgi:hypothetical protein